MVCEHSHLLISCSHRWSLVSQATCTDKRMLSNCWNHV